MKYLFDKDGLEVLEAFCFATTLFAFDYDGTLAAIVDDPNKAVLRPRTLRALNELLQLAPVAVISGRQRSDLLQFIPETVDYKIGNHGLEGIPSGLPSMESAAQVCRGWQENLQAQFPEHSGIRLEDKTYSLSLHYRQAADKKQAKTRIIEAATNLTPPPRIIMGKQVVNLVAAGAPHKGVALLELMLQTGSQAAVYIGDDDNDEDVFRLGEEHLLTVRVGKNADSAALFYIEDQNEIDRFLELTNGSLRRCGKAVRASNQAVWVDFDSDLS